VINPETTEFGYMEVWTTQWTSQWIILQNNTGKKKNKPLITQPDTKTFFISISEWSFFYTWLLCLKIIWLFILLLGKTSSELN